MCISHLLIKMKTGNQLKTHIVELVHLLADEHQYIDDSFVMVLSQKRISKLINKILQLQSAKNLQKGAECWSICIICFLKVKRHWACNVCWLYRYNRWAAYLCRHLARRWVALERRSAWLVLNKQVKTCSRETHSLSRASKIYGHKAFQITHTQTPLLSAVVAAQHYSLPHTLWGCTDWLQSGWWRSHATLSEVT